MKKPSLLPDAELTGRLKKALTAGSAALFQQLLDPHPEVLTVCLKNDQLNEDHLLALLKRRDLSEELLNKIYHRCSESKNHKLTVALVYNPATSGTIIRALLPHLHLFELVDLCLHPGVTADQRLAAERTILQRLPTTPLGNKITLARRASTAIVAELIKESSPKLTEVCLDNPRLKESAIYQFLNGPQATAETISIIARHSRWKQRPNLRLAILKNPRTPDIWFSLWLPKLPRQILNQLHAGRRLSLRQKSLVRDEINRRSGI